MSARTTAPAPPLTGDDLSGLFCPAFVDSWRSPAEPAAQAPGFDTQKVRNALLAAADAAAYAAAPLPLASYPPPQMLITLSGPHFLLEATDVAANPPSIDARDIDALLATVGRWAFAARSQKVTGNA